jgi:hypothetical protein
LSSGAHSWISQSPAWNGSAKKKCRWKVQTWGSFLTSAAGSPGPSWIFTVPLLPGASTAAVVAGVSSAISVSAMTATQAIERARDVARSTGEVLFVDISAPPNTRIGSCAGGRPMRQRECPPRDASP